jgi:hypothetical protein
MSALMVTTASSTTLKKRALAKTQLIMTLQSSMKEMILMLKKKMDMSTINSADGTMRPRIKTLKLTVSMSQTWSNVTSARNFMEIKA